MHPWVGEAIAPAGGIRATIDTMRGVLRSVHRSVDRQGLRLLEDFTSGTAASPDR